MIASILLGYALLGQVQESDEPYRLPFVAINAHRDQMSDIITDNFQALPNRGADDFALEYFLVTYLSTIWHNGRELRGNLPGFISTQRQIIRDTGGMNWAVGSIGSIADGTFGAFNLSRPMCFDGYTETVHDETLADALLCLQDVIHKDTEQGQYWILVDMLPLETAHRGTHLVFTLLVMHQDYFGHDGRHPYAGSPASLKEGLLSGNLDEKSFTIRAAYAVPILRRGNIVDALAAVDIVTGERYLPPKLYHSDQPNALRKPPPAQSAPGAARDTSLILAAIVAFWLYARFCWKRLRKIERIKSDIPPEVQISFSQTMSYLFRPLAPLIEYQRSSSLAIQRRNEELAKARAEETRRNADLAAREQREQRRRTVHPPTTVSNPGLAPVSEPVTKQEVLHLELEVQKALLDPHLTAESRSILIHELARARNETRLPRQKRFLQYALSKLEYTRPDRRQEQ